MTRTETHEVSYKSTDKLDPRGPWIYFIRQVGHDHAGRLMFANGTNSIQHNLTTKADLIEIRDTLSKIIEEWR